MISTLGLLTWQDEYQLTVYSSLDWPRQVPDLNDLPTGNVVKIAANGYMLAALTDAGDLYCWGGHPARPPIIEGLNGIPNLVDIDGKDIADVAVGDSHMIVLADDDRVMVIGNNTNGQLGLPAEKATTWTEVPLELGEESTVMAVRAGPKTSFLIIENDRDGVEISNSEAEDEAGDGTSVKPKGTEDDDVQMADD